jgi:ADP-heptose:LPS heptosyltransferase
VAVVVESPFHEILKGNPSVSHILVADGSNKLFARLQIIRQLRRFRPDIVIDLHGGTTAALLTWLSGSVRRVGYEASRNARFYTDRVPDSQTVWDTIPVHTVHHQLTPLKHLGFPVEPIPPLRVAVPEADRKQVERDLKGAGVRQGFVLIQPAAAFETKQWDTAHFVTLARRILDFGKQVVVTVGPGQNRLLADFERDSPDIVVWPPSSLCRFSALASQCGLYVGNDTGSTHIAAALGRPIVVVFGSSDSRVWHPWNVPHRLVRSDLPCIPCPGYYCLHYEQPRCIRSIGVDSVCAAVESLLCDLKKPSA